MVPPVPALNAQDHCHLSDNENMAAAISFLTLEEFEARYGDRKPYYEYWFGEAFPKSMPTVLHGLVQILLARLLIARGYFAASEVRLSLSQFAHPIPDLIANPVPVGSPYPTEPFELAVEILSPLDSLDLTVNRAAHYLDWKICHVWIIDPLGRVAYQMSIDHPQPVIATELSAGPALTPIPVSELWREVDTMLGTTTAK